MKDIEFDVSEIFGTIQGEGVSTGIPSIFVRLGRCNLNCVWCDTSYTWAFTEEKSHLHKDQIKYSADIEFKKMTVYDIVSACSSVPGTVANRVVITGGEPLYWNKNLGILVKALIEVGYGVEVETNGTIMPADDLMSLVDQWNVSPKLANSRVNHKLRIRPKVLKFFSCLPEAYFKFVVQDANDLSQVVDIVTTYGISSSRVLLMPEGRTEAELQEKAKRVIEYCKQYGFRFCPRVHIMIYGARRGV